MSRSGPQRKPTAIGLLSGSTRAKARARTEPTVGYAIPEPPEFLTDGAREYWPMAISLLENLRCITTSDAIQIAILAQGLSDWISAINAINDDGGPVLMNSRGDLRRNPLCDERDSAYVKIKDSLDRLGLNPSNRSRVQELATKLGVIEKIPETKQSRYADG